MSKNNQQMPQTAPLWPEETARQVPYVLPTNNPARDRVFGYGVPFLIEHGQSEVNARRVLGQMVRDHGDYAVAGALDDAINYCAGEPVSYLKKLLGMTGPVPNKQQALEAQNRAVVESFLKGRKNDQQEKE